MSIAVQSPDAVLRFSFLTVVFCAVEPRIASLSNQCKQGKHNTDPVRRCHATAVLVRCCRVLRCLTRRRISVAQELGDAHERRPEAERDDAQRGGGARAAREDHPGGARREEGRLLVLRGRVLGLRNRCCPRASAFSAVTVSLFVLDRSLLSPISISTNASEVSLEGNRDTCCGSC